MARDPWRLLARCLAGRRHRAGRLTPAAATGCPGRDVIPAYVTLRLYDRVGDADRWFSIRNTYRDHDLSLQEESGYKRARYVEPIAPFLAAGLTVSAQHDRRAELDEVRLDIFWRGF